MPSSSLGGPGAPPGRFLHVLLIVHGVVTLAAAVVLVVAPTVIPATVGIALDVDAFLLSYLLAAAELAIGMLSLGAARLADAAALRLIVLTFIVFHLSTAALEGVYLAQAGFSPVLAANIAVRVAAAVLFAVALRTGIRSTARP